MWRHALKGQHSSRELQNLLNLPVSIQRVQQILQNDPRLEYRRYNRVPRMTEKHHKDRLLFAQREMPRGDA